MKFQTITETIIQLKKKERINIINRRMELCTQARALLGFHSSLSVCLCELLGQQAHVREDFGFQN